MKSWVIPAKTFLLGEYAALADKGAIILTTEPCFKMTLSSSPGLHGIHTDSPAGRWWRMSELHDVGLDFYDPYHHCGGLGASSAQFLGAYFATCYVNDKSPTTTGLLDAYWQCAWSGDGLRPSGYDVVAQSLSGCVSLNRQANRCDLFPWPFQDLAFILAHTGNKLATHHHLMTTKSIDDVGVLDAIVSEAHHAFQSGESQQLVDSINAYHEALLEQNRVDLNTQRLILNCKRIPGLLAMKGCGAMGADVVLLITRKAVVRDIQQHLERYDLKILATSENLFTV